MGLTIRTLEEPTYKRLSFLYPKVVQEDTHVYTTVVKINLTNCSGPMLYAIIVM